MGLIPARGGSKGLPGKNIMDLGGKPLLAWTIEAAKGSRYLDYFFLSSDDEEIIRVAQEYGCDVPFQRPSELAKDDTPSIDVVLHAVQNIADYDFVVLLQPTSPFRKAEHIDQAIKMCLNGQVSSLVSIRKTRESPYLMYFKNKNNKLERVLEQGNASRRQDLPETWIMNGAIYLTKINYLRENRALKSEDTIGMEMGSYESVDIDSPEDLAYAELLLKQDLL